MREGATNPLQKCYRVHISALHDVLLHAYFFPNAVECDWWRQFGGIRCISVPPGTLSKAQHNRVFSVCCNNYVFLGMLEQRDHRRVVGRNSESQLRPSSSETPPSNGSSHGGISTLLAAPCFTHAFTLSLSNSMHLGRVVMLSGQHLVVGVIPEVLHPWVVNHGRLGT